jgi:hypothetical protein
MRARPEIRNALLVEKMKYWLQVAKMPYLNKRVSQSYARRRYWALVRKHPTVAAAAKLTETTILE